MSRVIEYTVVQLLWNILEMTAIKFWPDEAYIIYCDRNVSSTKLTDGDYSPSNFEAFTEACDDRVLRIKLGRAHPVHYVIIFEGDGNVDDQWAFLDIKMLTTNGRSIQCGTYLGISRKDDKGIRVNCVRTTSIFSEVLIKPYKKNEFYISEIELHVSALSKHDKHFMIYRGCFKKFGQRDYEGEECASICIKKRKTFVGIKFNRTCACDNDLDVADEISKDDCNFKCPEGYQICGDIDQDSYAVYLTMSPLPYVSTCTKDWSEENRITENDMTIEKCLHHCTRYKYLILMNGNTCSCSKGLVSLATDAEVSVESCNTKCSGDLYSYCGGTNRAIFISTCKNEVDDKLTCLNYLNCEELSDMFGSCGGACRQGYAGDHCLERDLSTYDDSGNWLWTLLMILAAIALASLILYAILKKKSQHSSKHSEQASVQQDVEAPPGDLTNASGI